MVSVDGNVNYSDSQIRYVGRGLTWEALQFSLFNAIPYFKCHSDRYNNRRLILKTRLCAVFLLTPFQKKAASEICEFVVLTAVDFEG